jgi:uncharacterized protein
MDHLPLFPLSQLLLPKQRMPLQIFEPRYLDLVSRCLKQQSSFGVVQIREGKEVGTVPQVFQFGVEAKIVDWDQLPNGLLGITVQGGRKFSLHSSAIDEMNLLSGEIEWLPDEWYEPIPDEYDGLTLLLQELRQHPVVQELGLPEIEDDSSQLGWQLLQLLPFPSSEKVALMSLQDPLLRLERLAEQIERWAVE